MACGAKLIVSGDDFGVSKEVNEAIIRAHEEGILTSCSLMVSGDAFDHAVRMAKRHRTLAVGIHLVCVMGKAVLPPSKIASIVDGCGNFSSSPTVAGLRYFFSGKAREDLKKELEAQFDKFSSTGLPISHIDSHLHMHVHPVVFGAALELGVRYKVKRMRVPRDEFLLAYQFSKPKALKKIILAAVFHLLCRRMTRELVQRGFIFPERVYGNLFTGEVSLDYVRFVLDNLREDSEFYFHPAVCDGVKALSRDQKQQLTELEIITDPGIRRRIIERGIQLTNYRGLEGKHFRDPAAPSEAGV